MKKRTTNNKDEEKNHSKCLLCSSESIKEIYRQENIPILNNVVYNNPEDSKKCRKGKIILTMCDDCGFVFNSNLNKEFLDYNKDYDNKRSFSDYYNKYINDLIKTIIYKCQIKNKQILEIGSGDGVFLKSLCKESKSKGIGFDPAYKGKKQISGLLFIDDYFSKKYSNINADILILRHVLEHIENFSKFLSDIIDNINVEKELIIIIEVPDFEWILKQRSFWDITYEHCNYFTKKTLENLFKSKKIDSVDIFNVFSGQYLVAIGKFKASKHKLEQTKEKKIKILNKRTKKDIKNLVNNILIKNNKINSMLNEIEKFVIWGMAGKGVIFINLLDKKIRKKIPFIIDINKNKQGKYCPGTDKKILGPSILKQRKKINDIIIMNKNYYDEISQELKKYNRKFNLIKI